MYVFPKVTSSGTREKFDSFIINFLFTLLSDSSPIEFNWMNKSFYQIAFIDKIMEEEIFCSEDSPVKMDSSSEGIGSNDPSFNFDPSGPVEDLTWDGVMALLKEKESICREKDEQLSIAGSTGLGLMEQVHSLQDELERQRKDHENECEVRASNLLLAVESSSISCSVHLYIGQSVKKCKESP